MSIFADIIAKIFPAGHPAVVAQAAPTAAPTPTPAPASTPPAPAVAQATPAPPAPLPEVDVEQILSGMASTNAQTLNWKTSIVDLMKLLGLDSSLEARKELAKELHYTGDMNDTATMNIWLQRQVMSKLAANGGKVPADLA